MGESGGNCNNPLTDINNVDGTVAANGSAITELAFVVPSPALDVSIPSDSTSMIAAGIHDNAATINICHDSMAGGPEGDTGRPDSQQ